MKKINIISMVCAVFLVGGCDHYSDKLAAMNDVSGGFSQNAPQQIAYNNLSDVAQIEPAAGGAMASGIINRATNVASKSKKFSHYLKGQYIQLAKYEQDEAHDYAAAKYYTDKIEKLQSGDMVMPASLKDFNIPADKRGEMQEARASLVEAMKTYRSPENRQQLAVAQASFDCWMDQVEDQKPRNKQNCRAEFNEAMGSLVAQIDTYAGGNDMAFNVPIQSLTTVISEETRLSLARALNQWRQQEGQGFQMQLSPNSSSTIEEQSRQLAIVRRIMEYNGVSAADIVNAPASGSSFQLMIKKPEQAAIRPTIEAPIQAAIQPSFATNPMPQKPAAPRRISYAVDY